MEFWREVRVDGSLLEVCLFSYAVIGIFFLIFELPFAQAPTLHIKSVEIQFLGPLLAWGPRLRPHWPKGLAGPV